MLARIQLLQGACRVEQHQQGEYRCQLAPRRVTDFEENGTRQGCGHDVVG
jgi:hypothetical protein